MSYPTLPASLAPPTPQRPLPGAWMQTPAVARHGSFQSPSQQPLQQSYQQSQKPQAQPQQQQQQPQPPAIASQSPFMSRIAPVASHPQSQPLTTEERGARTINETLLKESRYPDLDSYLSQGFSSEYDIPVSQSWAPFQKVKMYNIPDQIFDQYNRAQVSTSMGLFAELNHAWVSIDNALYLWDFTHPSPQLVGFEDQPNSINAVKLLRPRAGVFLPAITHLLVVATTAEVILLGMGVEPTANGSKQVTLYQTGMSASIRGLDINVFASSDATGRIFFGGLSDNDVYELTYQQEEGWFQNRCRKINHTSSRLSAFAPSLSFSNLAALAQKTAEYVEQMVIDDSRRLLYTLSSTSTIRVFHMKDDGAISLAITKAALDIYSNIGHIIASNETLNSKVKIVSISPVPAAEASRYHLVATTATGYRIYLSATNAYSWSPSSNGSSAPTSMQAQHVKTPPVENNAAFSAVSAPTEYGMSRLNAAVTKYPIQSLSPARMATRFPPGFFFCFTCKDVTQKMDTLFISSPDPGRLNHQPESVNIAKTAESAVWLSLGGRAEDIGLCSSGPAGISGGAAEIAILTNSGIHVIRRRRLVDIFAALARSRGSAEGEVGLEQEVVNFIKAYGRNETVATALAVACGQGVEVSPDQRLTPINDPEVLEFARRVFIEQGGRPVPDENTVQDNVTPAIDTIHLSPRHDGIALYISRLLRSIWKKSITRVGKGPNGAASVFASVGAAKLRAIQHDLSSLQEFFKINKSFIEGLTGPEELARVSNKQQETALQAEHRALHSLVQLVSHTIEGISFVLVLFDERVDEIVASLPEESKERFLKLTFEELFSTGKGREIAKELVKGIVNRNIAKGSNVETVADALRRRCGSFCSAEDVVIFKAQEQLKRATEAGANSELGRNLLNESLLLFQQVAENLPMDYLVSAVDNYISNQFFAGAISLALHVAQRSDKANMALPWIMDGRPDQDPRKQYFLFRQQCYDLIFKVIIAVDTQAASGPHVIDGQLTVIAKRQNEAYGVISDSSDEVFLTSLYDWYLEQGWSERLLQTQSSFVVSYLQRKSNDDIAHADLLWQYYAQSQRFFEAAEVQFQLAQSAFALPLSRRIEYLGRARANCSTLTRDVGRQERQRLLQEISNLIDVANIQDDLLQRLKDDERIAAERKPDVLAEVDGPVSDISTLFNHYADPAGYHDICLQIFFIGDYRNAADIKAMWQKLIHEIHERTVERGTPQPYEAVVEKVRSLGSRLRMSETVFPIRELLPMLERYSLEFQRSVSASYWVVDLFLDLGVAHDSLFTVLEAMFYTDEAPFQGSNRRYIAKDLLYLVEGWFRESARMGGLVFGGEPQAERVSEILAMIMQAGTATTPEINERCQELRQRIEDLLR
ncbi:Nucleoporin [Penicillium diatomitis]|uniref:Nucleoporin n=1 Tax=Penicillium diatomitis TaxID=2819901 RepID=A0A9X0BJD3_9EURO|nr:Nucleoporin [Penicillium diatomitis]KAJ5466661.1 Nucleoporin [Penicillium diatomitis]